MKVARRDFKLHSVVACRGNAVLELALMLPILMMLVSGVVDIARGLHFNNILVSVTREGANLASRSTEDPQRIITALSKTAEPLLMPTEGMIYITQLTLQHDGSVRVVKQARATVGHAAFESRIWAGCMVWTGGTCASVPSPAPSAAIPGELLHTLPPAGRTETFFAVEAFYSYLPLIGFVMPGALDLYSATVM